MYNPVKKEKKVEVSVTKRTIENHSVNPKTIERGVREILAHKVSGTLLGVWLLIPEHIRLGTWDLLKTWTNDNYGGIDSRIALQMVHESAFCVNGIRQSRSLNHQGFEIANGLPFITTDKQVHLLLDQHSIEEAKQLQIKLGLLRHSLGHYKGDIIAFDPHRINTYSKRIMPKKKSTPSKPSRKVLQTFFALDAQTGQPLGFTIGSSGKTVTRASMELLDITRLILPSKQNVLLLADTEHATCELLDNISENEIFDIVMPASRNGNILKQVERLPYKRHWAGYAIAEVPFRFKKSKHEFRLIGQRTGEQENKFNYKPFFATGMYPSLELITEKYPERWTIEEFFNFEGSMGWNRASTMNLNIRFGKQSLALIAQAATYQLKQKLPKPYKTWTASHLADSILKGVDGDLRVKDDTIIVTMYNAPESLNLKNNYENISQKLANEGYNPKIPWLYDFKLDFRFK